jgi:hypothetical protein
MKTPRNSGTPTVVSNGLYSQKINAANSLWGGAMANNDEWESITRGLEDIEYASLSPDEQSELITGLPNILLDARKDLISGEFTDRKLHSRFFRVLGSLQRQIDTALLVAAAASRSSRSARSGTHDRLRTKLH